MVDREELKYIADLWNTIRTENGFYLLKLLYDCQMGNIDHHYGKKKVDSITYHDLKYQWNYLRFQAKKNLSQNNPKKLKHLPNLDPSPTIHQFLQLGLAIPVYIYQKEDLKNTGKKHRVAKAYSISYLGMELVDTLIKNYEKIECYNYVNQKNITIARITQEMYESLKLRNEARSKVNRAKSLESPYFEDLLKESNRYPFGTLSKKFNEHEKYMSHFFNSYNKRKEGFEDLNGNLISCTACYGNEKEINFVQKELSSLMGQIKEGSPLWNLIENYLDGNRLFYSKQILKKTTYEKDITKFYKLNYIESACDSGALVIFANDDGEDCIGITLILSSFLDTLATIYEIYNSNWYQSLTNLFQSDQENRKPVMGVYSDSIEQKNLIKAYILMEINELILKNANDDKGSLFQTLSHNKINLDSISVHRTFTSIHGSYELAFLVEEHRYLYSHYLPLLEESLKKKFLRMRTRYSTKKDNWTRKGTPYSIGELTIKNMELLYNCEDKDKISHLKFKVYFEYKN